MAMVSNGNRLVLWVLPLAGVLQLGCFSGVPVGAGMDAGAGTGETNTDEDTDTGPPVNWPVVTKTETGSYFIIGDGQVPRPAFAENLRTMMVVDPGADALFHVGDLTATGLREEWMYHHAALADAAPDPTVPPDILGIPRESVFRTNATGFGDFIRYLGVKGNHDVGNPEWHTNWVDFLPAQENMGVCDPLKGNYFALVRDKVLFIALDALQEFESQTIWLESLLEEAQEHGIRWKVAFFHYPIYVCNEKSPFFRALPWVRLFEKWGVDMVFVGHAHTYERTCPMVRGECADGGVVYVNTSGGGAAMRPILPELSGVVTWEGETDEYACAEVLEAYKEGAYHFCHLEIDGGLADFSCFEADGYMSDGGPKAFDQVRYTENHIGRSE